MRNFALVILGLCAFATTTQANSTLMSETYTCERGVIVPSVYATLETGENVAVIGVDSKQIGLIQVEAASGVKYAPLEDIAGYIWWTKGNEASLYFRIGPNGSEEMTVLQDCIAFQ